MQNEEGCQVLPSPPPRLLKMQMGITRLFDAKSILEKTEHAFSYSEPHLWSPHSNSGWLRYLVTPLSQKMPRIVWDKRALTYIWDVVKQDTRGIFFLMKNNPFQYWKTVSINSIEHYFHKQMFEKLASKCINKLPTLKAVIGRYDNMFPAN